MAKVKRKCKVCGCEYGVCSTALNTHDRFAYEKVACSPACGAEYFRRVMEARGELEQPQTEVAEPVATELPEEVCAVMAEEPVCENESAEVEVIAETQDEESTPKTASKRKK